MSDSGAATENFLFRNQSDLGSDILIKGQHHSGISGTPSFLDCVHPQAIIASSRDFPESERLKSDWIVMFALVEFSCFARTKPAQCRSASFPIDGRRPVM
jgi:Predicted hydrolase (metallo-beta-lactamase superfamily)